MAANRHSPNVVSVGDHVDVPAGRGYVKAVRADHIEVDTGFSIVMGREMTEDGTLVHGVEYWPTAKYTEVEHVT